MEVEGEGEPEAEVEHEAEVEPEAEAEEVGFDFTEGPRLVEAALRRQCQRVTDFEKSEAHVAYMKAAGVEGTVEPQLQVEKEREVWKLVAKEGEEEKAAIEENKEGEGEGETKVEKLQALVPRRVSFTIPDTVRAGRFVYKVTGVTHDVFGRPLCAYKPTSLTERHTKVHLPQLIK